MKIGKTIHDIRVRKVKAHGLKQYSARACAARIGMRTSYWFDLEADRHSPSINTLEQVAESLGVRVEDILSNKSQK